MGTYAGMKRIWLIKPESNPPIPTGPAHIYGNLRAAGDPSVSVIFSAVFARPLTVEKGMSPMKHQTHSQRTPLVICGTKCLQITFHAKAFILLWQIYFVSEEPLLTERL